MNQKNCTLNWKFSLNESSPGPVWLARINDHVAVTILTFYPLRTLSIVNWIFSVHTLCHRDCELDNLPGRSLVKYFGVLEALGDDGSWYNQFIKWISFWETENSINFYKFLQKQNATPNSERDTVRDTVAAERRSQSMNRFVHINKVLYKVSVSTTIKRCSYPENCWRILKLSIVASNLVNGESFQFSRTFNAKRKSMGRRLTAVGPNGSEKTHVRPLPFVSRSFS